MITSVICTVPAFIRADTSNLAEQRLCNRRPEAASAFFGKTDGFVFCLYLGDVGAAVQLTIGNTYPFSSCRFRNRLGKNRGGGAHQDDLCGYSFLDGKTKKKFPHSENLFIIDDKNAVLDVIERGVFAKDSRLGF